MKLLLVSLLHPRSHIHRMLEIQDAVRQLAWNRKEDYGIVVGTTGYFVDCTWVGEKSSLEEAAAELERCGLSPSEYQLHPHDQMGKVLERRRAQGYYDEDSCHA